MHFAVAGLTCASFSSTVFVLQGKGTTFVVYNDAKLRVFRSDTGGVVVQTKADEVVPV